MALSDSHAVGAGNEGRGAEYDGVCWHGKQIMFDPAPFPCRYHACCFAVARASMLLGNGSLLIDTT